MDVDERDEQKEFENGPLSVLMQSVKTNSQVRNKILNTYFVIVL